MQVPIWISEALIDAIHDSQIINYGGSYGVRDAGLLQPALARPQNAFAYGETKLTKLAASYAYGIAKNHAFVDGNKRTALHSCVVFLKINGVKLKFDKIEMLQNIIRLAEGLMSEEAYADWLDASIVEEAEQAA